MGVFHTILKIRFELCSKHRGKIAISTLTAFLILASTVLVACSPSTNTLSTLSNQSIKSGDKLRVSYIDVGQGDSILIQVPDGKSILIDAGENDKGNRVVTYLQNQGVKRLDKVIWTHSHADHIGGADVVTRAFDIGQVIMPKETSTTQTYKDLITAIKTKGLTITEAKAGLKIDLGPKTTIQLVAPNSSGYKDMNDYSVVLSLTYGQNTFLFTGDAPALSEHEMISTTFNLKADVLKVGHHGSYSSTSADFLAKVQPKYAIISVGKGNTYGHPANATLAKLIKAGAKIYRTDESGTIVAESDGVDITFYTERN
ncbi:MAG: ComEC/Rec2 family competence protein [Desulfitobacteriaceae bacterium]